VAPLNRVFRNIYKLVAATSLVSILCGCQIHYYLKSAYYQAGLLRAGVPITAALQDSKMSEEHKRKLSLAQETRDFAERELGLKQTENYTNFVQLDRPYVTYVVAAAMRTELKAYNWWFPIVGSLPYKGFFTPEDAKAEADELKARGYDTFTRGVSAYSTLGWFKDPLLSSMLNYKDYDLVNTIIHETTHATIYIKSQADFNERLAVFIGNIGAREFYRRKEGPDSPTLRAMDNDLADEADFAAFIAQEMQGLEKWYRDRQNTALEENERTARFKEIQERFKANLRPRLRSSNSYKNFASIELNNARLMNYRLYFENLRDFELVFKKLNNDFAKMLAFCKSLEGVKDPKAELARVATTP
jgi:predicted aminopeptidase